MVWVGSVEWLKKQRDGLILGDYRNYLVKTYRYLESLCDDSPNNICIPDFKDLFYAVFGNKYKPSYIVYEYCRDLEKLGYVLIDGDLDNMKISVLKKMDF